MKFHSTLLLLLLLPCLPACELAGMYDQEYVFYDPEGEAQAAAEAEAQQAETESVPPQTKTPVTDPAEAVDSTEAGAQFSAPAQDLNRLFQLEAVLDEFNRAIRDGLDQDGSLATKREEVELELARRKREAGEAYGQERRRRLAALRNFVTQKDG